MIIFPRPRTFISFEAETSTCTGLSLKFSKIFFYENELHTGYVSDTRYPAHTSIILNCRTLNTDCDDQQCPKSRESK